MTRSWGILLALLLSGCAGGAWHVTAERGLATAAKLGQEMVKTVGADSFCRPVIDRCKRDKDRRCDALTRCHDAQRKILEGTAKAADALRLISAGVTIGKAVRP